MLDYALCVILGNCWFLYWLHLVKYGVLPRMDDLLSWLFFLFVLLVIQQGIFGHVPQVRETTISSIVILLTRRYPSLSDCKNGTKRCLTRPCLSELSMTIRSAGQWGGHGRSAHLLILLLCILPFNYLHETLFVLPLPCNIKLTLIW